MIFFWAASRTALDGQTIQAKTTFSPSCAFTAILKSVVLPSGMSSPQHSTSLMAPCCLNTSETFADISR